MYATTQPVDPGLSQVDAMINQAFGLTLESERVLLRYLRHILDQGQCSYSITPSGSYPLKTYLPDSDTDVCLEVPDAAATWHLAVTQALIGAATPVDSDFRDFTAPIGRFTLRSIQNCLFHLAFSG
ncbi:hypothetical protein DYB30_001571 [Aphanomyces astaci]|uniref:Uncharacterized protein n=1 Tax=Aphanomyces astaci TaxID=112090 RepID=A0A397C6J8_APHAT|nr:hypothetical protein DYB30_001571 [Aphanomyces astaci]RHZ38442.1 hypothetical protein DYB26_011125 [Aphanomyces astaci]